MGQFCSGSELLRSLHALMVLGCMDSKLTVALCELPHACAGAAWDRHSYSEGWQQPLCEGDGRLPCKLRMLVPLAISTHPPFVRIQVIAATMCLHCSLAPAGLVKKAL